MKKGFTLVELSIVLVIIGLLIGGVLVAQSMISTTKIQKTIREMQQYTIATQNFQTQFNCLPGDCANNLGFHNKFSDYYDWTATGYNNGNGDGLIGSASSVYISPGIFSIETFNYWAFLEQAGMIPAIPNRPTGSFPYYAKAAGIASPTPPVVKKIDNGNGAGGGWWVFSLIPDVVLSYTPPNLAGANVFYIGSGNQGTGGKSVIRNADSAAIDAKLDDGLPLSGNIQAISDQIDGYSRIASPSEPIYARDCLDSNNNYKVGNTSGLYECALIIKADFN